MFDATACFNALNLNGDKFNEYHDDDTGAILCNQ